MATIANETERTISSETMNSVLKYAPKDGFKLTDLVLNKEYSVVDVDEFEIGTTMSFSVTLEDNEGNVITLSASALKRSRVITTDGVEVGTPFTGTDNVFKRSDADAIWNGSSYYHKGMGMKKDEDFIVPEKLMLRYAILSEDQDNGEPLLNPFLFKDFRKVVKEYAKTDSYPSMDDFREELLKTEDEGRYSFLSKEMLTPTPYSWVKKEVSDFRHTLVFQKV